MWYFNWICPHKTLYWNRELFNVQGDRAAMLHYKLHWHRDQLKWSVTLSPTSPATESLAVSSPKHSNWGETEISSQPQSAQLNLSGCLSLTCVHNSFMSHSGLRLPAPLQSSWWGWVLSRHHIGVHVDLGLPWTWKSPLGPNSYFFPMGKQLSGFSFFFSGHIQRFYLPSFVVTT